MGGAGKQLRRARGPPPARVDRLDLALLAVIVVAALVATLGPVGTNDIGSGFVGEWQPYPSDSWQFGLRVVLTAG